jgi:hypothetical protein
MPIWIKKYSRRKKKGTEEEQKGRRKKKEKIVVRVLIKLCFQCLSSGVMEIFIYF